MEKELNIADILKDKPVGTKLWSPIFGNCVFSRLSGSGIRVFPIHNGFTSTEEKSFFKTGQYTLAGEVCLFPSKQMQDWSKFAWKKGDVLVNRRCLKILFDRWANDNYTSFYAKTINLVEDAFLDTNLHTLASEKEAKSFIRCIEEKFGGKLNLETLEIEQPKPEFKDGDILHCDETDYSVENIFIAKMHGEAIGSYAFLCLHNNKLHIADCYCDESELPAIRLATDSEKHQLFLALAEEGKRWNPDTKQIEDLPKKCESKPMGWCLMKDSTKCWELCQFAYTRKVHGWYNYSYDEETKHLLGTTDEWKGGNND